MFEELWSEIADAPGEIFDIPEMQELEDLNWRELLELESDEDIHVNVKEFELDW